MKKRSKLLAGLTAGVMAISAMCFGFAQWTTDISLSGNVSAAGAWDVSVTDASIVDISSTGTTVDAEPVSVAPTGTAVVYPVKLAVRSLDNWYVLQIDDRNGQTLAVNEAELAGYEYQMSLTYGSGSACYFASGIAASKTTAFMVKVTDFDTVTVKESGAYKSVNQSLENKDNGASAGKLVGYAILKLWGSSSSSNAQPNNENLKVTYKAAQDEIAKGASYDIYPATIGEDKTSVTYAPVAFSLPGAWAQYAVTITNNGTANANLSNYQFTLDQLDGLYQVDMPEFGQDEMLAPGESCTIRFVISVDADESFQAESQSFSLRLTYVQDSVEAAPTSSHIHSGK